MCAGKREILVTETHELLLFGAFDLLIASLTQKMLNSNLYLDSSWKMIEINAQNSHVAGFFFFFIEKKTGSASLLI